MKPISAEAHLGLAHLCANRFRGKGIEYDELYSAGCLGLVKASNAFDPDRGVCFSTYAVPVIMGEIRRLFRDGGTVRVGRRLYELSVRANQVIEQLRQDYGTEPTVQQIAEQLDLTVEETAEVLCAMQPIVSLTACNEDGESIMDIPIPSHETALQEHMALQQVLALLCEKDRRLIQYRYEQNMTQSAAAERLGMTQVQVSRREKKILTFLRKELQK